MKDELLKDNKTVVKQDKELTEKDLDTVAGGVRRAGGDDDLEDLELEQ